MSASWGLIATVKAPTEQLLDFCAHHLELGAQRLYIYLDDCNEQSFARLRAHPKIKPVMTDAAWWEKRRGRPDKHQSRQFLNARHACNRRAEVQWLAHIDVDEFLMPEAGTVGEILERLPLTCLCARMRPAEALAEDPDHPTAPETCFKAMHVPAAERQQAAERAFPEFGRYLSGGFLSHVAGKLFFRAGIGMKVKIHNVYMDDEENPGEQELPEVALLHMHAESWEDWRARFDYRMAAGSYREGLKAPVNSGRGGLPLHDLFTGILEAEGEAGLRRFYETICRATPALQQRLAAEGLLRRHHLSLGEKRARHFPGG
ncbi:glycosyltransferase family 2 protein [Aquicoccus sp. SCR17]|nr:glycosyltransferase family 2 protein [Carideicomes alvinocaridis]